MTERPWPYNSRRVDVALGWPGDAQESSFMNATLQSAGAFEFSIAMHVDLPEPESEDQLADTLGMLLKEIADRHPEVEFEVKIGSAGPTRW